MKWFKANFIFIMSLFSINTLIICSPRCSLATVAKKGPGRVSLLVWDCQDERWYEAAALQSKSDQILKTILPIKNSGIQIATGHPKIHDYWGVLTTTQHSVLFTLYKGLVIGSMIRKIERELLQDSHVHLTITTESPPTIEMVVVPR